MSNLDERYVLSPIYLRRIEHGKGLFPINALTGAGKSTAISSLYLNPNYNKFTVNISNNKKNIEDMFNSHLRDYDAFRSKGPNNVMELNNFSCESLLLYSDKDMLEEMFDKDNKYQRREIFKFFTVTVNQDDKRDATISKLLSIMRKKGERYEGIKKLKDEIIKSNGKKYRLITKGELEYNMTHKTENNEPYVLRRFKDFRRLVSTSLYQLIKEEEEKQINELKCLGLEYSPLAIRERITESYIEEIINNEDGAFSWLLIMFPQFKLLGVGKPYNKLKRVYLNIDKFLSPLNMLIPGETNKPGYFCDFLDDSVTFIDEIDECYKSICDHVVENNSNVTNFDYIKENVAVMNHISNIEFSNLVRSKKQTKKIVELEKLINEIKLKYEGELQYSFKILSNNDDITSLIFYGNYTEDGVIFNDYYFYLDEEYNCYNITKDIDNNNLRGKNVYNLRLLLKDMNRFMNKLTSIIYSLAYNIQKGFDSNNLGLSSKKTTYLSPGSIESAAVLCSARGSDYYKYLCASVEKLNRDFIVKQLIEKEIKKNKPNSVLFNGFNFFNYRDNDRNNLATTSFHRYSLERAPEAILFIMSLKSTVIPLSATQDIVTRFGNFDYNGLRSWLGNDHYFNLNAKENLMLSEEYGKKINNYRNIDLQTYIIKTTENGPLNNKLDIDVFYDEISQYFPAKIAYEVAAIQGNKYNLTLFKSILYAFKLYIEGNSQYGLFLNMFSVNESSRFTKQLLTGAFDVILRIYNINNVKIYICNSDGYKEVHEEAEREYNAGNRVIIITSYGNLSNGQNASFYLETDHATGLLKNNKRNKTTNFIKPNTNNIGNFSRVDADFIYLGEITNVGVKYSDLQEDKEDEEDQVDKNKIKYILQAERAYELGFISKKERIDLIKRVSSKKKPKISKYDSDIEAYMETIRVMKQTIGRIARNSLKNERIIISSIDKNIKFDTFNAMETDKLNLVEFRSLFEKKKMLDLVELKKHVDYEIDESLDKQIAFADFIHDLVKKEEPNIRTDKTKRITYDEIRTASMLFPFFNSEDEIPEALRPMFIKLDEPMSCIYGPKLGNYDTNHTLVKTIYSYREIGLGAEVYDILDNEYVQRILKDLNIKIPSKEDKFLYFPNIEIFNNITCGIWAEIIFDWVLKDSNFKVEDLGGNIYELFDSAIFDEDNKRVFFIDYKNWREIYNQNLAQNITDELVRKAKNKITTIKNLDQYKNYDTNVLFMNLYDRDGTSVDGSFDMISKAYKIYDMRSFFYKDEDEKIHVNKEFISSMHKVIYQ